MKTRLSLLASTVAVLASLLAAAPATASADAVQWTVTPATGDTADDRISLRHVLDPGATATDAIAVTNTGAVAADFEVRAGDGVVGADGAFDIATGDPVDAGSWIAVDPAVRLEPGETRVLPVTLLVPADAEPGDHPAGIVVGVVRQDEGVVVRHRIGVRVHLQVAGEITPALEMSDVTASFTPTWNPLSPGTLRVDYTVTNAGNVRLGASEGIDVAGPFGLAAVSARGGSPAELLPGASVARSQEIAISPLALLTGGVTVSAVALGDDAVALPDAVSADFSALAVPWSALAALVILAVLVVLLVWMRRRGVRRTQERIDAAVAAARAEA